MQEEATHAPLEPEQLKPARYFAAGFAGEHVAGTEFVIGALFVSWGVGAADVIIGLIFGNLLAVLSWALICAPIATETRLTLYAYLEKICGPGFMQIYSVVNGVLFCVLAGAMITVSASAMRIPFGIAPQVAWYPTSIGFVAVAIAVGSVVSLAAARGFETVSRFAEATAPWLICIFFVGAIAVLPVLMQAGGVTQLDGITGFVALAERQIWIDRSGEYGVWHVVAIAWGANLAFHGALGDMSILRFARKASYGWLSVIGMFIGHFGAWLAAGIMGAAAAVMLQRPLTALDAGEVAYQALGVVGIAAVVLAGWTTSNPTIYRAGLAFQSINPAWSRECMTVLVGAVTTVIACFPFVFTRLLDFLGLMALVMAPTGGIIMAEHYLLRRLRIPPYWRAVQGDRVNRPALLGWGLSLGLAGVLHVAAGWHVLFLFVPAWTAGFVLYPLLCRLFGAQHASWSAHEAYRAALQARRAEEAAFSRSRPLARAAGLRITTTRAAVLAAGAALCGLLWLALEAYRTGSLEIYLIGLPIATAAYFGCVMVALARSAREHETDA